MNPKYSLYLLHRKIDEMSRFINLDRLIQGEKNSIEQIRSYYRINNWAYRRFHSQDGFMHFRITTNGCFTDEDVYHLPDSVSKYIKPGDVVVELGFGQGANLLYLAHCHIYVIIIVVETQARVHAGVGTERLDDHHVPGTVLYEELVR